jgi:hypothetical protein
VEFQRKRSIGRIGFQYISGGEASAVDLLAKTFTTKGTKVHKGEA